MPDRGVWLADPVFCRWCGGHPGFYNLDAGSWGYFTHGPELPDGDRRVCKRCYYNDGRHSVTGYREGFSGQWVAYNLEAEWRKVRSPDDWDDGITVPLEIAPRGRPRTKPVEATRGRNYGVWHVCHPGWHQQPRMTKAEAEKAIAYMMERGATGKYIVLTDRETPPSPPKPKKLLPPPKPPENAWERILANAEEGE